MYSLLSFRQKDSADKEEAKDAEHKPIIPMGIMAVAGVVILIIVAVVACGIPLGWFGETKTKRRTGVVTELEAVYARRVVPCFDEPDLKAEWTITVIHPEGTTALSNGKEISIEK
uniref:Peptidase_M1_N domain-containing protein n=1 Tax=Haemonchus placei TaxID=6290 RepID=A0A158QKW1_HAEPC